MRLDSKRLRVVTLVAIAALGLAACGDDDDEAADTTTPPTTAAPQGAASVTVDMHDYSYAISGAMTQGGTLRVANRGEEFHMLGIGRFKPGKTMADLQQALSEAGPPGGGGPEETTTTARGGTTTTARGGTTTTARGGTTTTAAAGESPEGDEELQEDPTADIVEEVGFPGAFQSPGQSAEVSAANLTPGTYAFICFIPTEEEGTPHFAKGMISQFEVVEGTPPPEPTADATYRVAPGQVIEGPATLEAGRQTLKIEAAPGSEQLEPSLGRLNPGATFAQVEAAFERLFETEDPPPDNAPSMVPAQIVYGGFDLEGVTSFYLTADFTPGNYVLVAEDTDPEDRPSPPRELIQIRVT